MLTLKELAVLDKITEAWEAYCTLPVDFHEGGHHEDTKDFRYLIHRLQDIIASRSAYRDIRTRRNHSQGDGCGRCAG